MFTIDIVNKIYDFELENKGSSIFEKKKMEEEIVSHESNLL
jgi:hypothetical protein